MTITPFSDTPRQDYNDGRSLATNLKGGLNTSEIDPFRQGIELSLEKYSQLGGIKISAGEPNHGLKQLIFGQSINVDEAQSTFQDTDGFNSRAFISAQGIGKSFATSMTFPIKTCDNFSTDGVIEPLTIRAKISFSSIESPFESHDIYGDVGQGNSDIYRSRAQVTQFTDIENSVIFTGSNLSVRQGVGVNFGGTKPKIPELFYLDGFETLGNITLPGEFCDIRTKLEPFSDGLTCIWYDVANPAITTSSLNYALSYRFNCLEIKPGVLITPHEIYDRQIFTTSDLISASLQMSPATDNYVPAKKRSLNTGYTFDNAPYGVDSLAFGGLTYKNE